MSKITLFQKDGTTVRMTCDAPRTSDGAESFASLYEQVHLLFCAFVSLNGGWKSRYHNDGTPVEGGFLAGSEVLAGDGGEIVTYTLPMSLWGKCHALSVKKAPRSEIVASDVAITRLKQHLANHDNPYGALEGVVSGL